MRLSLCLMVSLLFLAACNETFLRAGPPPLRSDRYLKQEAESKLAKIRDRNFSVIRTEMALKGMSMDNPMLIRAFKSEMKLELWVKSSYGSEYELFKSYNVCKKSGKLGPKLKEGDLQTPEGFYAVHEGALNPNSRFFLSFNIGFPNEFDRYHNRTGSLLMIHGDCVSEGCLAMTNKSIGEIYMIIEQNFKYGHKDVPIHIYPFRMTDENLNLRALSEWQPFWQNLKQGYDMFERDRIPPEVGILDGEYVFNRGDYF